MRFTGFTHEAFDFYLGLQGDNSKAYWTAHKEIYERAVRDPMTALLAELEPEFGPARMFRPFHDMRFNKGKPLYKTHQGAHAAGGLYCQVDADGLMVGGGMYAQGPEQIRLYRAAVLADHSGKELEAIVDGLREAGWQIAGDRLKTRPRGAPQDHPRIDLLRHRSLYARRGWPSDEPWLATAETADRIRHAWRELRPLVQWGLDHCAANDPLNR